jgi:hypothetical protein
MAEEDYKLNHNLLPCSSLKADFNSVQNVARLIFFDRFLLKCVQSTTANERCSASLFAFQKKAIAKSRLRNILH